MDSDSKQSTSPYREYLGGQILGITFSLTAIVESLSSNQLATAKSNLEFVSKVMADFRKEGDISLPTALGAEGVVGALMDSIKGEQKRRAQHSSKTGGWGLLSSLHPGTTPTKKEAPSPHPATRKPSLL